jgi:hypothetical protein
VVQPCPAIRTLGSAAFLPSPAYDQLLDAAARSLKAHGFKEILFIGDSGGNQAGMAAVAKTLNEEWKDGGTTVFALTDYYEQGRVHYRAWLEAQFGYDDALIGSHAGISDTSQMLYVHPAGIRADRILPWGGPADSGVTGNPALSTADIGRMGIAEGERRDQPVPAHQEPTPAARRWPSAGGSRSRPAHAEADLIVLPPAASSRRAGGAMITVAGARALATPIFDFRQECYEVWFFAPSPSCSSP